MLPRSLRGKKIRLSCTLKDKQGALLGEHGSVLVVGKHLSIKLAKQLLAGASATILDKRLLKPFSALQEWPSSIQLGPFEGKGKADAKTISVHVGIQLNSVGCGRSWLKLRAAPSTFCELFERWFSTVTTRHLGILLIKSILKGGGDNLFPLRFSSATHDQIEEIIVGRVQRERAVPVTIRIKHDRKEHDITLLTESSVFKTLASFHHGDEASDVRFGKIFREALHAGRDHVLKAQLRKGKKGGKFPTSFWSTAAWLGPALLNRLRQAYESHPKVIETIHEYMTEKSQRSIKLTPKNIGVRNMGAFLVDKNWQNFKRRQQPIANDDEENTNSEVLTSTIALRQEGNRSGTYSSVAFWDKIFYQQLKLKSFPWARLRNKNIERFKELMEQPCKEHYLRQDPTCDWDKLKRDYPTRFKKLIDGFIRNKDLADRHMKHYLFSHDMEIARRTARRMEWTPAQRRELRRDPKTGNMLLALPTQGPTFILPKSLEETVDDILLNRDVFILSS